MRMQGQIEDTRDLLQRLGLQTAQSLGGVGAGQFLEAIRRPSDEPYWKLRRQRGLPGHLLPHHLREDPRADQGHERSCRSGPVSGGQDGRLPAADRPGQQLPREFNLFYDPTDKRETGAVRNLATSAIQP